ERFGEVEALLQEMKLTYALSSQGGEGRVLLVNEMGKLKEYYAKSDLAIIGGTFVEHVGGHNLVEPCQFGVPVFYGPHVWSQTELHELVQEFGAGEQVALERLADRIRNCDREKMSKGGLALMEKNRGATDRIFSCMKSL